MFPEPVPYIPCYMVTPAMEIIDLTWMCGHSLGRSPVPLKTERELFIERMANEFNERYCSDSLMPLGDAAEYVAKEVNERDYTPEIYLEIIDLASDIRDEDCLFESAPQPED